MLSLMIIITAAHASDIPSWVLNPMHGLDPAVYTAGIGVNSTLEASLMQALSDVAEKLKVELTDECGSELSVLSAEKPSSYLCSTKKTNIQWTGTGWKLSIDAHTEMAKSSKNQSAEYFAKHILKHSTNTSSAQWSARTLEGNIGGSRPQSAVNVESDGCKNSCQAEVIMTLKEIGCETTVELQQVSQTVLFWSLLTCEQATLRNLKR